MSKLSNLIEVFNISNGNETISTCSLYNNKVYLICVYDPLIDCAECLFHTPINMNIKTNLVKDYEHKID